MKKLNTILLGVGLLFSPSMLFAQGGETPIAVITADDLNDVPSYNLFQKGSSIVNLLPNIQFSSMTQNKDSDFKTNLFNVNLRANYYVADNIGVVAGIHINNEITIDPFLGEQKTELFLAEIGAQYGHLLADVPVRLEATVGLGNYTVFDNKSFTIAYNVNVATYVPLGETSIYLEPFIGYAGFTNNFNENDFVNKTSGLVLGASLVKNIGCGQMVSGFSEKAPVERFEKGNNRLQFIQAGALGFGSNNREFDGENFSSMDCLPTPLALLITTMWRIILPQAWG